MRILFHGNNLCCQNPSGGIRVRMMQIAKKLEEAGHQVDFFNPYTSKILNYDVVHCFSLVPEHYDMVNFAYSNGVKVVISSIVGTTQGWKIDLMLSLIHHPMMTIYNKNQSILKMASTIIVETQKEQEFIIKHYKINRSKISIVPNGIDCICEYTNEVYQKLGYQRDYILCVGRIDRNKNQLNVIKALKDSNIDIIFIGGPTTYNDPYYQECLSESKGHENIHFWGWIDNGSALMSSAYANAKVFIFPSFQETFGMVLIEAANFGANLVVSNTLPILDYPVFRNCSTFSPNNIREIREKTIEAYSRSKNPNQTTMICKAFSWDTVIDKHIQIYNK